MPAMQFQVDGRRMDASPSWPIPTVPKLAETAAPDPPDDPPTVRSKVVGVAGGPEQRAVGVARAQLAQGGLGQHDGPGLFELLHHPAVPVRVVVLEHQGAQGGGGPLQVRLVLDEHRDSVERAHLARGLEGRIQAVRLLQRRRVHRDDGVDSGAAPVIGLDAIAVHLHQLTRREASVGIRGVDVLNGGFRQRERICGWAHMVLPWSGSVSV